MKRKQTGTGYVFEKEMKRTSILFFFMFFSVFWNAITWTILPSVFAKKEPEMLIFLLFPAIGLGMIYFTLVLAFNKIKLTINATTAVTKVGPLPWMGNFKINRNQISQIYVEQYVSYTKNDEPIYRFAIKAISQGGRVHEYVMKGLQHYEEALVIEKCIEDLWSIQDKSVREEFQEVNRSS
ncbi:MAG: hypothetical protein KC493_09935 [Bacteriovoracaceae bacterium]|nr:hypothetical protein [Bacteriovoracaceae bacterium]